MKVRFTSPTEAFPFFHNVTISTKVGWKRIYEYSERGKMPAIFPTKEEMVAGVKRVING